MRSSLTVESRLQTSHSLVHGLIKTKLELYMTNTSNEPNIKGIGQRIE